LFVVAILAYWVAGGIVNDFEIAREQTAVEEGTNLHVGAQSPELPRELWDRAPELVAIAFIVAYEIRRRVKRRNDPLRHRPGTSPASSDPPLDAGA
jgi:hypothetical protein